MAKTKISNTNYMLRIFTLFFLIIALSFPNEVGAFVQQSEYSSYDPAGFFSGIWHGLLAPWSLIARWFIDDIGMYAFANTGWFYDFGFLFGVVGSIPIGWLAVIISVLGHIFL